MMKQILKPTITVETFALGMLCVALWLALPLRTICSNSVDALPALLPLVNAPQNVQADEEVKVYTAVVKEMYEHEGVKLLVITRETGKCNEGSEADATVTTTSPDDDSKDRISEYTKKKFPELAADTIASFNANFKQCSELTQPLNITTKHILVSRIEIDKLRDKDNFFRFWERFYKQYPESSGIISFSRAGFNRDHTQAFVSTSNSCGGLCGAGYDVLLIKENGVWQVADKTMVWVS